MASFEFSSVDSFTTGTVGPKGERIFFLQAISGSRTISLKLEKQQVAAMAEYLAGLLADLPELPPTTVSPAPDLAGPIEPLWIVGALGAAYDDSTEQVVLMAEEVSDVEDDEEQAADSSVATFRLTLSQTRAFIDRARAVVEAGRPPCPFCARPLDHGEGGFCPCWN